MPYLDHQDGQTGCGLNERRYWRLEASSLPLVRGDRCCPAAACNANILWHRTHMGPAKSYFILRELCFHIRPERKMPHEGLSSMPGFSPDPRLRQPLGCNSPSEAEVYSGRKREHGAEGCGGFSLVCFLPAQTREISGTRDVEQWPEELAHQPRSRGEKEDLSAQSRHTN
ncbi:hypothetical protein HJG60_007831 [Phyllostomus discolor]|uniref:Uncharacterized protein n=1 Tax=Phyllostomus discolor TaxID=89673 RepID=A0A834BKL7_9CHIR|nr:hypothetical protein HJG60_007831 [Phyllostomus discolor]